MRDEAGNEYDAGESDVQSNGQNKLRDSEKPDEHFARDCLAPARRAIARGHAWRKRGPETRHRFQVGPIRFALTLSKSFFFAKNQSVNKQPARRHN